MRFAITYVDPPSGHGLRLLSGHGVLAVKDSANSAWSESALSRGKVENIALQPQRDMVRLENFTPDRLPGAGALSQRDRARQRGPAACLQILKAAMGKMPWRGDEALLILDWHPGCSADWHRAARHLQDEYLAGNGTPTGMPGALWSACFCDSEEDCVGLRAALADGLYQKWFSASIALPTVGFVGRKEILPEEAGAAPPAEPSLRATCITAGTTPGGLAAHKILAISAKDQLEARFGSNSLVWNTVKTAVETHEARFGRPTATPPPSADVGADQGHAASCRHPCAVLRFHPCRSSHLVCHSSTPLWRRPLRCQAPITASSRRRHWRRRTRANWRRRQ